MSEEIKKIIASLKHWNLKLKNPKYDQNFQSRLILQKLAYICKTLGLNLNKYYFSLYKNGPYCPTLTEDYYKYSSSIVTLETDYNPTNQDKEIFDQIGSIVLSHPLNKKHQADLLEAVATILYLKKQDQDILDDELFKRTKNEKPFISDKIIIIAVNIVKELIFKEEFITEELKNELDLWDRADD